MIEVLARNKNQYIVAIDYRLYFVDEKKNIFSIGSIKSSFKISNFKYGIFTNEYSVDELKKISTKAKKYDPEFNQYKKDIMADSGMSNIQFDSFIKETYKQDLAGFNEFVNKEIFHNVKLDSNWINQYSDYL